MHPSAYNNYAHAWYGMAQTSHCVVDMMPCALGGGGSSNDHEGFISWALQMPGSMEVSGTLRSFPVTVAELKAVIIREAGVSSPQNLHLL